MPIQILGRVVHSHFYVVHNLTSDSILGNDFIEYHGLSYDSVSKRPFFQESQAWTSGAILSAERVTLPARASTAIRVKAKSLPGVSAPGPATVISSVTTTALPIAANEALVEVDEQGQSWIIVDNLHDTEVVLHRDAFIGTVEKADPSSGFNLETDSLPDPPSAPPPSQAGEPEKMAMLEEEISKQVKELPSDLQTLYRDLILKNHDVFSKDKMDLGRTSVMEHEIHLEDESPIYTKQFRIPESHRSVIMENLRNWIKLGVVAPTRSLYNSPIFCVPKKDGSLRAVLDFRKLNNKSFIDKYSQREVQCCIDEIGRSGSKVFSSLDLTAGFWQLPLAEKSRPYTAFTIPGVGSFHWCMTPMGLLGSPATFGRLMDYVMRNLQAICYQDDILPHSRSHKDQIVLLQQCFNRLRSHGLKLNVKKCSFGQSKVPYLGHTLTPDGVLPGEEKTQAIRDCPPPQNVRQIREFTGLCNFFRSSIKNFSILSKPLTECTSPKNRFGYKDGPLPPEALKSFHELKERLLSPPILSFPDPNLPYFLWVDAAVGNNDRPGGVGAALMQMDENDNPRAIGFASKSLDKHEKNYSAFLLEKYATYFGVKHFEHYLKGRKFIIYTDHKPITYPLSSVHQKTFGRYEAFMQDFDSTIVHKPGPENVVADFLSRNPISSVDIAPNSLKSLQISDPIISSLIKDLENNCLPSKFHKMQENLILKDGILHIKRPNGDLAIFAPSSIRPQILQSCHNSVMGGHLGIYKTQEKILSRYFWPGMSSDIEKHIKECVPCQQNKPWSRPKRIPLKPLPATHTPNARVHIDLFGPLKTSRTGKRWILVATCAFSKYVELAAIPSKEAEIVARAIYDIWISRYSAPKVIVTDNGKEFANRVVESLCNHMKIIHNCTSPYHPEANSQVEVFNRTMRQFLQATVAPPFLEWEHLLPSLRFAYNTSVSRATQTTPFSTIFGLKPNIRFFDFDPVEGDEKMHGDIIRELQYVRKKAAENNILYKEKYAKSYNSKLQVETSNIEAGDYIFVERCAKLGANPKLQPLCDGPYKVLKVMDTNISYQKGKKVKHIHLNHVKKAFLPLQGLMEMECADYSKDARSNPASATSNAKAHSSAENQGQIPRVPQFPAFPLGSPSSELSSRVAPSLNPEAIAWEPRQPEAPETMDQAGPSTHTLSSSELSFSPPPQSASAMERPSSPFLISPSRRPAEKRARESTHELQTPASATLPEPDAFRPRTRSRGIVPEEPLIPRYPIGSRAYKKHRLSSGQTDHND